MSWTSFDHSYPGVYSSVRYPLSLPYIIATATCSSETSSPEERFCAQVHYHTMRKFIYLLRCTKF